MNNVEALPARARTRARLRPTAFGVKATVFFAGLIVAFFAAPYTNLFFLLLAFLVVLAVIGTWTTARHLRGFTIRVNDVAPGASGYGAVGDLQAGPRCTLDCVLTKQPRFGVAIDLVLTESVQLVEDPRTDPTLTGYKRLVANLGNDPPPPRASRRPSKRLRATVINRIPVATNSHTNTTVSASIQGLPRGVHRVSHLVATTSWPLGIMERRVELATDTLELIAHPRPLRAAGQLRWIDRGGNGIQASLPTADGSADTEREVAGMRPWRDGDELRNVSWRASARRDEPIVREFEQCGVEQRIVVLDRNCTDAELELRLGVATALLLESKQAGEPVTLIAQNHVETYGGLRGASMVDGLAWLATCTTAADSPLVLPGVPRESLYDCAQLARTAHDEDSGESVTDESSAASEAPPSSEPLELVRG